APFTVSPRGLRKNRILLPMLSVSVCCSPLSTSASMLTKAAPIGSVCQFTSVRTSMTEARNFWNRKYRDYSSENPLPQLLRPPQHEYINPERRGAKDND